MELASLAGCQLPWRSGLNRLVLSGAALAVAGIAGAQVVAGQTDTFSADTQSWQGASPSWISTGGPAGAGDGFLQLVSTGQSGPGSHMAGYNTLQWDGNYTAAGVAAVSADFNDLGSTDLVMR